MQHDLFLILLDNERTTKSGPYKQELDKETFILHENDEINEAAYS